MNLLKGIVIFTAGFVTGGVVSYSYFKTKATNDLNNELAAIREDYYNKMDHIKAEETAKEIIKEEGYTKYNSTEPNKEVITNMIEDVTINTEDRPTEDYPAEPIMISEADFAETELYFEKRQVEYYLDDGALVDEDEIVEGKTILNIDDTIGFDNLDEFLKKDDIGIMYVRNAHLGTDFEVTKISGKYSDIIGIGGDDDED